MTIKIEGKNECKPYKYQFVEGSREHKQIENNDNHIKPMYTVYSRILLMYCLCVERGCNLYQSHSIQYQDTIPLFRSQQRNGSVQFINAAEHEQIDQDH